MATIYSSKQQQKAEKDSGLGWALLGAAVIAIAAGLGLLSGCASTLDKTVSVCLAQERDVEFTQAEGFTKASCSGPSRNTSTTNVKVAR